MGRWTPLLAFVSLDYRIFEENYIVSAPGSLFAIYIPAVIALPELLLAALPLAALLLVAALEITEGGDEGARDVEVVNDDARGGVLLIATFALEFPGAEYQLFKAELL